MTASKHPAQAKALTPGETSTLGYAYAPPLLKSKSVVRSGLHIQQTIPASNWPYLMQDLIRTIGSDLEL